MIQNFVTHIESEKQAIILIFCAADRTAFDDLFFTSFLIFSQFFSHSTKMANSRSRNSPAKTILYLRPQGDKAIAALDLNDNKLYQDTVVPPSQPTDIPLDSPKTDPQVTFLPMILVTIAYLARPHLAFTLFAPEFSGLASI